MGADQEPWGERGWALHEPPDSWLWADIGHSEAGENRAH